MTILSDSFLVLGDGDYERDGSNCLVGHRHLVRKSCFFPTLLAQGNREMGVWPRPHARRSARHTPLGEIAFRKGAEQIETFSAGFAETSFDERGYAR